MQQHAKVLVVLAALVAPLLLAGCTNEDHTKASPEVIAAVENTRAMDWEPGNFWAYRATFQENRTYHIALVVHEAREDGFRLGSNLSAGFFGLPFSGNVTPSLNPEVSGAEWPMFRFPLHDGKTWEYSMFGYDAKTTAHAAMVSVPGVGSVPGFRFESSSYGQVFARYDYAPEVGWFTRLELIEPTDRTKVLDVRLEEFGTRFGKGYFVERVIERVRIAYPTDLPGETPVRVSGDYLRLQVALSAQSTAGAVDAKLTDHASRAIVEARATGKGLDSDRATLGAGRVGGAWTLEHAGVGAGTVYLEITGVTSAGARRAVYQSSPERVDMVALLSI